MRHLVVLILALALAACGTTGALGQDTSQGAVDQNVRGGIFASYTGQHGAGVPGRTVVTRTRTGEDGQTTTEVVEVMSGAPFVMLFDSASIEGNTDASTQGSQSDAGKQSRGDDTASPTTNPSADVSGTGL